MPKKKKKDESLNSQEGRPRDLTFADFIVTKKEQKTSSKTTDSAQVLKEEATTGSCSLSAPEIDNTNIYPVLGANASSECEIIPPRGDDNPNNCTQIAYYVCRTKKGGVPVKVENRASGKKVTLIEHVVGDGKVLLSTLKSKFGTGGLIKGDVIELQGDLVVKLSRFFNENKQLLKPYGTKSN